MESDSSLSAIALAISLISFSFASLASACIGSVRRDRIEFLDSHGVSGAGALKRIAAAYTGSANVVFLLSILSFAASLLSAAFFALSFEAVSSSVVALASLLVLIILGIINSVARRLSLSKGEQIALRIAPVFSALNWLLTPILAIQTFATQRMFSSAASEKNGISIDATSSEVSLPLHSQIEPLDEHEVRMIRAVVQLDKTTAKEVMVPRVDMVAADISTSIAEIADHMVTNGHSRIPVYNGDLDHIEGVAHARDILGKLGQHQDISEMSTGTIVRPAFFIPETKTLEELLNEFQQERVHMAIVIDEYGGVSGLVTIEDLLEEIVGEIQDEFDTGEMEIEKIDDDEYVIDARVGIDELNKLMNTSVEANGFDTIGGFVYDRLGKIPSPGDLVDYNGLNIEVISTVGRRLKRLRVKKSAVSSTPA